MLLWVFGRATERTQVRGSSAALDVGNGRERWVEPERTTMGPA
jgi:hypothetical protein